LAAGAWRQKTVSPSSPAFFDIRTFVMENSRASQQIKLVLRLMFGIGITALASCGGGGPSFPKAYPVSGKILVNGQPALDCQIRLHRTSSAIKDAPLAVPQAITNQDGEFNLTSYNAEDGAPEGEYIVTIEWRERSGVAKQDLDGADRLGGAYSRPEKTKTMQGFVVKVEKQPLELPPFKLTQSAEAKRKAAAETKQGGILSGAGGPLK
jgi:hypothetical protein